MAGNARKLLELAIKRRKILRIRKQVIVVKTSYSRIVVKTSYSHIVHINVEEYKRTRLFVSKII